MQRRILLGMSAAGLGILVSALTLPKNTTAGKFPNIFRSRTSVERLAEQIDSLERHIELYGSVVAKQPDVWGEARLTKHRGEYENILEGKKDGFEKTINASISRSDQAFLANALSISAAISGPAAQIKTNNPLAPTTITTVGSNPATPTLIPVSETEKTITKVYDGEKVVQETTTDTTSELPPAKASTPPAQPERISPATIDSAKNLIASQDKVFERKSARLPESLTFGEAGKNGVALEPTIFLDQLSRYVNHLHQLRRINEGDDTSDAPGYAMNLIRVPVSILPGKCTQKGYGAEVTMTLSYCPSDDLLPRTFRNLVINDLVEQLSLPLQRMAEAKPSKLKLKPSEVRVQIDEKKSEIAKNEDQIKRLNDEIAQLQSEAKTLECDLESAEFDYAQVNNYFGSDNKLKQRIEESDLKVLFTEEELKDVTDDNKLSRVVDKRAYLEKSVNTKTLKLKLKKSEIQCKEDDLNKKMAQLSQVQANTSALRETVNSLAANIIPIGGTSRNKQSRYPVNSTRIEEVFGEDELFVLAKQLEIHHNNSQEGAHGAPMHLFSVQGFLKEELEAAYNCLIKKSPKDNPSSNFWNDYCPDLATKLKSIDSVTGVRNAFYNALGLQGDDVREGTRALAWAILVESAMLNERFYDDMDRIAAEKGCACDSSGRPALYGPDPCEDAKQNFRDYVQCRWPIHVFALDPVEQDQNVADSFSLRREMQLALALAFTSGKINASNFTSYMRRIEAEVETIALNKTVVGFSHGHESFGWRFYPRVQTPPIKSHLATLTQDFFIGGPGHNEMIRDRRLEPGMRECTALVIMPSFIPYVTMDIRTNWFKLTNPRVKQFNLEDTVELSRQVRKLYDLESACIKQQHLYRDGEVHRLCRAVDQLETRLALQTEEIEIPYENTLGGYALFSSGLTTLGPELVGYYGEPGVSQEHETVLFLVGNHFSVHDTRVVAAGQEVKPTLISRQVMQVKIPAVKNLIGEKDAKYIDVHVATPYGVSEHLHIQAIPSKADKDAKAVTKAVEDHIKDQHPVSVSWKGTAEGKATVEYEKDSFKISEFKIKNPELIKIKIEKSGEAPADLIRYPTSTKMAMFVKLVSKKDGKVFKKIPVGRWQLDISSNDQPFEIKMSELKNFTNTSLMMDHEVQTKIVGEPAPDGLKEVVLEAFIRFDDDGLPVIRLGDVLKFELTELSAPYNERHPILKPAGEKDASSTPSASSTDSTSTPTPTVSDAELILPPLGESGADSPAADVPNNDDPDTDEDDNENAAETDNPSNEPTSSTEETNRSSRRGLRLRRR